MSSFRNNTFATVVRSSAFEIHRRLRSAPRPKGVAMIGLRTSMVRVTGRAAVLTAGIVLATFAAHSASLTISETGSTLILPLFKAWVSGYAKVDPDLNMTLGA